MAYHPDPVFENLLLSDDVAELLAVRPTRIKQLARDNALVVLRRGGKAYVPAKMIEVIPAEELAAMKQPEYLEDETLPTHRPLWNLQGTITVLRDNGFSSEEVAGWLWQYDEELEAAPIDMLIQGFHHRVNVLAATQGF